MVRVAQLGFALAVLGTVVALVGLFPGVAGRDATPGFGLVQIAVILVGLILLVLGGLVYAKFMYFAHQPTTLVQAIGVRVAFTGLTFATLAALADELGFGSNVQARDDTVLGPWQGAGLVICFVVAAVGVLVYVLGGEPVPSDEA